MIEKISKIKLKLLKHNFDIDYSLDFEKVQISMLIS